MIQKNAIIQWRENAPWKEPQYIEQDLIISRAIASIYQNDCLGTRLIFRGGTAIYKLFLNPPERYSEDLDFVQTDAEPIGGVLDQLRDTLSFINDKPSIDRKNRNTVMLYRFEAEEPRGVGMKLKIEINCREHHNVLGLKTKAFKVENQWYTGNSDVVTYDLNELIGTKLRALYQRKKGRDLFDIYKALKSGMLDVDSVIHCYYEYMSRYSNSIPTPKEYIDNLTSKVKDPGFRNDILPMLAQGVEYYVDEAFDIVKKNIIDIM